MADSRAVQFFRLFSGKSKPAKQEDGDLNNFRRTRSLCEGRAGISPVYPAKYSGKYDQSLRHYAQPRKLSQPVPRPVPFPISSMDPNKPASYSSSSLQSRNIPLPAEVVQLCESAFGKLYSPFEEVRWTLLEQIRRIFYGDCNGDIQALCHNFLAPAANLVDTVRRRSKENSDGSEKSSDPPHRRSPSWPLCFDGKVIVHLTELDPEIRPTTGTSSILKPGEFYFHISRPSSNPNIGLVLCLKLRTLLGELIEVRVPPSHLNMAFSHKWFEETIFQSSASDARLLGALQFCVVSFERSIDRIDLHLLTSGWRGPGLGANTGYTSAASSVPCSSLTVPTTGSRTTINQTSWENCASVADECRCLCKVESERPTVPSLREPDPPDPPLSGLASSFSSSRTVPQSSTENGHQSSRNEYSNSSIRSNLISQLHENLLLSGAMTFPGVLDRHQHPVIFVFASRFPVQATEFDVADLFAYFYTIPRESVSKSGFTIVVDTSLPENSVITGEKFLSVLDGAVRKSEDKIPSGIHRVLIIVQSETPIETADQIRDLMVKSSSVKIIFLHGRADLRMQIDDMSILNELGGRLNFNHQKFVAYRKEIEPFLETCRHASRRLLESIQDLKLLDNCVCQCGCDSNNARQHNFTAAHYNVMIQAQKKMMQCILEDRHLLRLQTAGDSMLLKFQQESAQMEAKDSYDQATQIYNEVHTAAVKLAKLADRRLAKLEKAYHIKRFEEDTRKVLSWIGKKGEEALCRHAVIGENLNELRQQQRDFEKFYFTASHQIEKGSDLLEEFSNLDHSDHPSALHELHRGLRETVKRFSERLDDIRDRIDDSARCYCLVERAFEWTLSTINFMSQFKVEPDPSLSFLNEQLQKMEAYVRVHPALPKDNFNEMDHIASRLKIPKLIEQCAIARARCQEAESLTVTKETSFLKAKFALLPVRPLEDTSPPRSYYPVRREGSVYFGENRNSSFRQASIPEMDETSCSSEPPFIDADSVTETDSVPIGSVSSTQDDLPTLETASSGHVERRPKGNMKRSLTWQCGEGGSSRGDRSSDSGKSAGNEENCDGKFSEEDFSQTERVRVNRRESWTVPTSNTHLLACLPKDMAGSVEFGAYGNTAALVMQELLQTEQDYITALRFVIDNYLPEVFKDSVPQMLRGKRNVVFGNLSKIYDFHDNEFSHALDRCAGAPFHIGQVFLRFEKQFYLYALYTHNKPKSDELMAECGNEYFRAKQIALQDKMDLSSYLLRPVQRMGKYALLLKQLLKVCPRTDPEWADLQAAEEMVKFQLRHGNDLLAMDLLRDCDVNLKEQGRLLRQDDMLVWQGGKKKTVRRVFLFEEIILFSKSRRTKNGSEIFLYKTSLKTNDLGLTEQMGDSVTKFEIWFRKRKSGDNFVLQASNGDIKQAWTRDISTILWNQAFKSREARMAEMTCMGIGNKACLDIKPSEDQINHRFVNLRSLGCRLRENHSPCPDSHSGPRTHQRPHSVISLSSTSTNGSTLISGPVPTDSSLWPGASASYCPEDSNESPRRSQCSSESGLGTDMVNSSSPVDSDSSK